MKQDSHTSKSTQPKSSRRDVLTWSGKVVAASTLGGLNIPAMYAAEDNTIRLALIGCGGRGCGAAANAFDSPNGPVKLVAMADFFENRLANAHKVLSEQYGTRMDVPPERRFVGFNARREVIHYLRPGDVATQTVSRSDTPGIRHDEVSQDANQVFRQPVGSIWHYFSRHSSRT